MCYIRGTLSSDSTAMMSISLLHCDTFHYQYFCYLIALFVFSCHNVGVFVFLLLTLVIFWVWSFRRRVQVYAVTVGRQGVLQLC